MSTPEEMSAALTATLFIFLGWLLGLLSPAVVEAIKKRHRNREIREAILSELIEARYRLAISAYALESRYVRHDRKLLEWFLPIAEGYRGPNPSTAIVNSVRNQLNTLSDAQFEELSRRTKAEEGGASTVKKFKVPYLESKLADVGIFDEKSQRLFLDIRSHFDLYNDHVDEHRLYFNLTFSNLSEANYEIASQGVYNSYQHLSTRARIIIDRINELVPLK